jgi:hypothetical protein
MVTTEVLAPNKMPMSIQFMARYGEALLDAGYRILPIQPGTKKPGMMRQGQWFDYPQWSRHGMRETTAYELDVWATWPDAAIGVATGNVIAIDIDVPDEALAKGIQTLAFERLGVTNAIRIGRAPKRLLLYRAETAFAGFKRQPIEVLGLGQQFVAYGIHPDTGAPYQWPVDDLSELALSALPAITEAQARRFLDEAYGSLPPSFKPKTLALSLDAAQIAETQTADAVVSSQVVSTQSLRGTVEAISSALLHLPNDDLDYDSWVRVGLAIKGALNGEG